MNESIYNLIPQPKPAVVKPDRYQSKYNPRQPPTGSTFGLDGTTSMIGANLGVDASGGKPRVGRTCTFGKPLGSGKPDPGSFLRTQKAAAAAASRKAAASGTLGRSLTKSRMPPVPRMAERPVMGLQSTKNYVTANAVEAILAVPGHRARVTDQQPVYRTKVDYGKVPAYLGDVKQEIERENEMIESYIAAQEPQDEAGGEMGQMMDGAERDALVDALKTKWDAVNVKYQRISHIVKLDTLGKMRRKTGLEEELTQLEKDIQSLESRQVVVMQDQY
jgi:hypothetical protein